MCKFEYFILNVLVFEFQEKGFNSLNENFTFKFIFVIKLLFFLVYLIFQLMFNKFRNSINISFSYLF